jgi:hypothetical protein
MIDGAHEGAFATHPTIADRIAAIISVTGSMALIAPARRDTRQASAQEGFGRRPAPGLEAALLLRERQRAAGAAALARVSSGEYNRLGLTPELTVGAVAAIAVFLWAHSADLRNPAALVEALDPAPMRTLFAMGREHAKCLRQGIAGQIGQSAEPADCSGLDTMLAEHKGDAGLIGKIAKSMTEPAEGMYAPSPGTFTTVTPPAVRLAEIQRARCFQTGPYSVDDRGLHSVTEEPSGDISLPRYLALSDDAARRVTDASPAARDKALLDYYGSRKTVGEVIHRFFGDPGLQVAAARHAGSEHQAAVALLRERLTDPSFSLPLNPLTRAELELLTAAPLDFVSCVARRAAGEAGRINRNE